VRSGRVLVIGGGIAGLSAAWHLARRGVDTVVVERELFFCSQASGRNAGIFRTSSDEGEPLPWALRSRELLDALAPEVLRCVGALYVRRALAQAESTAHESHVERFVPEDGLLDIHALGQALAREARRHGAVLLRGVDIARIVTRHGIVAGVESVDGRRIEAAHVVVAAGAWCSQLALRSDLHMPLRQLRRHLVWLAHSIDPNSPIVWCLDPDREVYFRTESGGVLASPCDEGLVDAGLAASTASDDVIGRLAERLQPWSPTLAQAGVRRAWTCLRTFAPDREFVVGADPGIEGLHWLGGLGGRGMSAALALGELLVASIFDGTNVGPFAPQRLAPSLG